MPHQFEKAITCIELCRFSYKMYAQTLVFPFDPFFDADPKHTNTVADRTRPRMIEYIHDKVFHTVGDNRKFEPIQSRLDTPPNPEESVFYRRAGDNKYLVFLPGTWDKKIGDYEGFDIKGARLNKARKGNGQCRCGYFQGETGKTVSYPTSGWPSYLGAAIYDPEQKTAYVVFRGSRSSLTARAAKAAQFHSKGNPDWVTDMNHLKEATVYDPQLGPKDFKLAAGFALSCSSATKSWMSAFKYAVNGELETVCFTGHSLGGALAQCAYIYLCTDYWMRNQLGLKGNVKLECYPIAAPPVCMDIHSQHSVSRNAHADNVHHYYCPYDAIHACDLVLGAPQVAFSALGVVTHPTVKTYHFGSQVALDSDIKFPAAHEPSSIWKAIWNRSGEIPLGFWQEVELDPLAGSVKCISGEDVIKQGEIVKAIRECYQPVEFITRARQWAEGISDISNKAPAIHCLDEVERLDERNLQGIASLASSIKQRLLNTRSDTAGCVYYTLLVSVVLQGLMAGNIDRAAPKNQMPGLGLLKR